MSISRTPVKNVGSQQQPSRAFAEYVFFPMWLCEAVETIFLSGNDLRIDWAEDTRSNSLEWSTELAAVDPDEDDLLFKVYSKGSDELPGKVDPNVPGADFPIKPCVTDEGEAEDCQPLTLKTRACPIPE